MNHLKGKTLMVMDRTALAACAVRRAKELGIRTIVANFYPTENSPSKQVADEAVDIDISKIDDMVALIKEKGVDGVFVGWTDSHLPFYAQICEKAGLPCCGTVEQFDILSNDKRRFKKACLEYGVPTIPEYKLDISLRREDLDNIEYPVLVKPADESGSRGIKRCDNEQELVEYYTSLYNSSRSKKLLCEKYIDSPNEIFIHYTVQDGYPSQSANFMKLKAIGEDGKASSAILHMFSSPYTQLYRQTTEPAVINMIKQLGIRYGNVMFQGFEDNGKFYFFESGLRLGGEQFYVFAQPLNGISSLDMMIEFALTGKMTCGDVKTQDNCLFSKSCCNYYITLKGGKIARIEGLEEVLQMPQVLQNATFHAVGDVIQDTNSLDRVIYRMHVMDENPEALAETLCKISTTLRIYSEEGYEMQVEQLTYERALEMTRVSYLRT